MNTLKQEAKERSSGVRYPTLTRIKVGRAILFVAALPLMSLWMAPFGAALAMPVSFPVWVKSKINFLDEWRRLI